MGQSFFHLIERKPPSTKTKSLVNVGKEKKASKSSGLECLHYVSSTVFRIPETMKTKQNKN